MEIKIYNSLTNKLEVFKPIKENEVSMYVCGPTVYNDPHIGNMRPAVVFDTFVRFLTDLGYKVKYVSNFTDVDDKIINKALELNKTEKELTDYYIDEYKKVLNSLNILPQYKNPRVTEYMDEIINYIDNLVKTGHAYVVDGEVFFDVNSVQNYGILSNLKKDELISGARVEQNEKKKNPLDFLLWKKTDKGIKWHTKWCDGRPGWHTECCVMIDSIFNGIIDIHGGGIDLKFPHHENEIAQSYATHQNYLANYWMHNAMMNINGDKMSKSLGNVILAKDAIKEYGGDIIRLFLINAPYRSVINLNDETIKDNASIINKISSVYKQLNLKLGMENINLNEKSADLAEFLSCLADDLNVPNAITYLLNIIKKANQDLRNKSIDLAILKEDFLKINDICYILGLSFKVKEYTQEEKILYNKYIEAKNNKDFSLSDTLRAKLIELNIL